MLLLFHAGGESYGIPVDQVVEVLAVPRIRPIATAPAWALGTYSHHGRVVPVIDVSALLTGVKARLLWSTRIAVTRYRESRLLGLLAEGMMETVACREEDFQPAGIGGGGARSLGDLMMTPEGMIQRVTPDQLLSPEVRKQLFPEDD